MQSNKREQHDSYRYFRGNRLAVRISCTVRPAGDADMTAEEQPSCLFYTNVLKFADKLRVSCFLLQILIGKFCMWLIVALEQEIREDNIFQIFVHKTAEILPKIMFRNY